MRTRQRSSTIHFEQLQRWATRSGRCTNCQKRRTRSTRIWATLNPFNLNSRGEPKSRVEVVADLDRRVKEWRAKPFLCATCERAIPFSAVGEEGAGADDGR